MKAVFNSLKINAGRSTKVGTSSLGLGFSISANAGLVMRYVVLAILVAVMRKIGHKVCDELEAE